MDLRKLDDNGLLDKTDGLVREERELLTAVLHHLREIERRRLFASLGYKSLFEMTVVRFGYSEDQAYRRIAAMRLLKELPEIEEKINSGAISLGHINLAQTLFNQERKVTSHEVSRETKLSIVEQISNKSVREAERLTIASTDGMRPLSLDRMQLHDKNSIEFKFVAPIRVQKKLSIIKGYLAHKHPALALGDLFDKLCDLGIDQWNPAFGTFRKRRVIGQERSPQTNDANTDAKSTEAKEIIAKEKGLVSQPATKVSMLSQVHLFEEKVKYLSWAATRRKVFARANSKCQNCGSTYALEIDHIVPKAKGGHDVIENLRVLCRSCNQREAIKDFGQKKMDAHLS